MTMYTGVTFFLDTVYIDTFSGVCCPFVVWGIKEGTNVWMNERFVDVAKCGVISVISDNKQCIARAVSRLTANAASFTNPDVVCRSVSFLIVCWRCLKVCGCCLPKVIKISLCLSKLQLAKVAAFLDTMYNNYYYSCKLHYYFPQRFFIFS